MFSVVGKGVVFAGEKGSDVQSAAFPGICVLPSGRWVCIFRVAPTKKDMAGQRPLITWSDDDGSTWAKPIAPFVPPAIDGKPGLFRTAYPTSLGGSRVIAVIYWVDHSDPSQPFFNEATEGLLDSRIMLSHSEDDGATWSEPELMGTTPFNVPTPITGPILCL